MRGAVAVAFAALCLSGCGGSSEDARSPLDDALGYLPRDVPVAIALETGGPQSDAAAELLGRVPVVSGRLYASITNQLGWAFIRFERDIRPLLGHELVVGVTDPRAALRSKGVLGRLSSLVVAWRVANPSLAKRVIVRSPDLQAHARVSGVRLWKIRNRTSRASGWLAIDDDVFVAAGSRTELERAIARRRAGDRFTEDDFDRALEGLPDEAVIRARVDPRRVLGSFPGLRGALAQRWIASLRHAGVAVSARPDGFALDFRLRSDSGAIEDADLPLAPRGPTPAALRRGSETGVGVSEPGRLARFADQLLRAVQPGRYLLLDRIRARLQRRARVDIQRDLLARLSNLSVAFSADGTDVAARAGVVETRAFRAALERVIPAVPELGRALGAGDLGVASPAPGQRFFAAAVPGHQSVVFGLVGNSLVASDDTRRAGELVTEPSRIIPGARGAAVISADAGALAERFARDRVRGLARVGLPLALRPVGDLTGWIAASREGLRGQALVAID